MTMAAVLAVSVSKTYGSVRAVQAVNLTVLPGEIVALVGPSGCGKTTALRIVAGFERPDAGSLDIGGVRVAGPGVYVPPERHSVGMVFQEYALFPHMTVLDNVSYGLGRRAAARETALALLSELHLTGLEDRLPASLSGGQQQRVALARALAPRPAVLLLDEPLSNLDERHRAQLRHEVRRVLKNTGTSAIFVTHDQEEALMVADTVAVMNAGRLEQIGPPEEVFHQPANLFVAEFFGATAFLSGVVEGSGIQTELGRLDQPANLPGGERLQVLVRPDDLILSGGDSGGAVVEERRFAGIHNHYRVRLPSQRVVNCLTDHTEVYALGESVTVELARRHPLAVFTVTDAETSPLTHGLRPAETTRDGSDAGTRADESDPAEAVPDATQVVQP